MRAVKKAVMSDVPDHILEWRRTTGAARRDEVWEGVLHMAPDPSIGHQELSGLLLHWLLTRWARRPSQRALPAVDVSRPRIPSWTKDYRNPDLALVTAACAAVEHAEHFEGGPDVVVEIRSPGDETYDKLPFYAAIGRREVWVVDRDSRACEIYAIEDGAPVRRDADASGWTASQVGVELRTEARRLWIRLVGDDASGGRLP